MTNPWFKFYAGEYLGDPKILQLNGDERSCWVTLLCIANQADGKPIRFLSEEHLIFQAGAKDCAGVLKKFESLDMIRICNGSVTVLNWEKRQKSESYSRVQKFRDKKRNEKVTHRVEKRRIENTNTSEEFPIEIVGESLEEAESNPETPRSHTTHKTTNNEYSDSFQKFWELFPRKEGKRAANHLWESIKAPPELLTRIYTAVEVQRTTPQWKKENGKYIPLPTNWLRDARWEDEVKGTKQNLNMASMAEHL